MSERKKLIKEKKETISVLKKELAEIRKGALHDEGHVKGDKFLSEDYGLIILLSVTLNKDETIKSYIFKRNKTNKYGCHEQVVLDSLEDLIKK